MVRMFINIGRSQKITVKDIIQSIAIEADVHGKDIGMISIYDKFTFVEVPEEVAEKVLAVMHRNTIKRLQSQCGTCTRKRLKSSIFNNSGSSFQNFEKLLPYFVIFCICDKTSNIL